MTSHVQYCRTVTENEEQLTDRMLCTNRQNYPEKIKGEGRKIQADDNRSHQKEQNTFRAVQPCMVVD